jgi:hypothetical protein
MGPAMNDQTRSFIRLLVRTLASLTLLGATQAVLPCLARAGAPATPGAQPMTRPWATDVHNLMIATAFADTDPVCLGQLDAGSREADSGKYQAGAYSYMHAMRAKGQSAAEAARLMWNYVDEMYGEVRRLERAGQPDQACYYRGMGLHPVMDSTSPAHRGFQEWDPVSIKDLFSPDGPARVAKMARHGDITSIIERIFSLPTHLSLEDMQTVQEHPEYLELTTELMRIVDQVERLDVQ